MRKSLNSRLCLCIFVAALPALSGCSSRGVQTAQAPAPAARPAAQGASVIVVHGSAGYWPGCKDFAANLAVRGAPTTMIHGWEVNRTADRIAAARQAGGQSGPLVLIGYSRGANDAIKLTRRLHEQGITVNKLVLMETAANDSIPPNVESCLNVYQTSDMTEWLPAFRGMPVTVESPDTQLTNYNLRFHDEGVARSDLNHFTVCRNYAVLGMISEQVVATLEPAASRIADDSHTQLVGGRL